MRREPFERGATYRAKETFRAFRDSFDPGERLVFFRHAVSSYDGMEGWFFRVDGASSTIRAWDHELGERPPVPFDEIAGVDPIVGAAAAGDVAAVERCLAGRSIDDAYVLGALDLAIENDRAPVVLVLAPKVSSLEAALREAAGGKKIAAARALVAHGTRSDAAVWSAVWSGSLEIVELLIAHGCDPKKMGQSIDDAIAFCERQNHPAIKAVLERHR